ncbi:MAG: polymer-forming cytoskeletal protein [Bacteroidales bacterium]|nr:polymer-forming cytoskeletal protein [Bacteroidales bacterium]
MSTNQQETSVRNNLIGNGTTIKGEIIASGDIRVDGTVVGTIKSSGKIVVGQQGIVEGDMICKSTDVSGHVKGNIRVDELTSLKSTSRIEAELYTKQLFIEVGAIFTGKCDMSQQVAEAPKK